MYMYNTDISVAFHTVATSMHKIAKLMVHRTCFLNGHYFHSIQGKNTGAESYEVQ
jgi:hypothetical protein